MDAENIPDPRIAWHLKHSGIKSELAVRLALAASPRGNQSTHEWEAYNAKRFDAVLEQDQYGHCDADSTPPKKNNLK